MSGWTRSTLADVVTLQRGHDLPAASRGKGQVPVIGSFGVTGFHDVPKYKGPGVAIGRSGASIGVATYVEDDYWPLNTALFVKDFKSSDPRWAFYLLDSIDFTAFNSGSAQPSLNRNYLANIEVNVPPVSEQRAIAATLGALDDKIESNRRKTQLAQELLRAQYRSWFSKYSPWGGRAPKSWQEGKLRDVVDAVRESIKPGVYADRPYIPIDAIPMNSVGLDGARPNDEARSSLFAFEKNDILVGAMRVYFHRVALAPFPGITRNTTFVLRPRLAQSLAYCLLTCDSDDTIAYAEATSKGSTMPYAVWDGALAEMPVLIPDPSALGAFEELTFALIEQIRDQLFETQTLIALRDSLLPELLSGRIRVPAEEAAA
ncbi:restriction endonuclease subunit S [Brevibacterium jeotgali]|uniref:Type I restriction enzyme, S subunit n=1 Tax=Brevibacterium jeotgali TaxID=1262550 RepID=A0A2H1L2T3_9MICO|nr:restriction endonuclease subunit S [Brevibacterium jeotgali]TWC02346.1 type I restriction enzyme S subunit [Brevibacterium jeotgali]SMY11139.1 type I restriction enzyme, S subunit [Brevibacterium jeotgali]